MLKKKWTFIDLFAGIGGFHLALESLGGDCVFASEFDKHAQSTYAANFGFTPQGDITKIDEKDIPTHDVLCAGFPCQAFSVSGKQLGFQDTRGTLFFDVARIVNHHKPKVVFLENVKNFARHDDGKTMKIVLKTMKELGYQTYHHIIKSSEHGVPQARERVYLVCLRNDLDKEKKFTFPINKPLKPITVKSILESKVSDEYKINRTDIMMYKDELDIKNPYSAHQIGKINKGGQGERIYSIHTVGITLSAYGGGAAAKTGAYLVDGVIRKLTPKECLKMQGFPSSYKLPVSKNIAYKQLGNSVSVPVIKRILKNILKVIC
jgi:DNA (cytosine-5)-methyltransferase 1